MQICRKKSLLHDYIKITRKKQHVSFLIFIFYCIYSWDRMYLAKYVFIQYEVCILKSMLGLLMPGLNLALQISNIMLLYYNMLSCSCL